MKNTDKSPTPGMLTALETSVIIRQATQQETDDSIRLSRGGSDDGAIDVVINGQVTTCYVDGGVSTWGEE